MSNNKASYDWNVVVVTEDNYLAKLKSNLQMEKNFPLTDCIESIAYYNDKKGYFSYENSGQIICFFEDKRQIVGKWHYGSDISWMEVAPNRQYLVILSKNSGTISTIAIHEDGLLGEVVCHLIAPGMPGPNRIRQLWAHPCSGCFDNTGKYLLVADTGNDLLSLYEAPSNGRLRLISTMPVRPASCPVQICRGDKDEFFVISDGIESLYCCMLDRKSEALRPRQIVQPLPETYTGLNVRCKKLFYEKEQKKLFFYVEGCQSVAEFSIEDGVVCKKRWKTAGEEILGFIDGLNGAIAVSKKKIWSLDKKEELQPEYRLESPIKAIFSIKREEYVK